TFAEPAVALASGAREALRLADIVESMLRGALSAVVYQARKRLREIAQMDTVLDRLHLALKLFLTELSREDLTEAEQRRLTEIMAFAINLEHIGDI
ncbi:PhoU domain-containing protein, partial [Acinetobacter baumannii]